MGLPQCVVAWGCASNEPTSALPAAHRDRECTGDLLFEAGQPRCPPSLRPAVVHLADLRSVCRAGRPREQVTSAYIVAAVILAFVIAAWPGRGRRSGRHAAEPLSLPSSDIISNWDDVEPLHFPPSVASRDRFAIQPIPRPIRRQSGRSATCPMRRIDRDCWPHASRSPGDRRDHAIPRTAPSGRPRTQCLRPGYYAKRRFQRRSRASVPFVRRS